MSDYRNLDYRNADDPAQRNAPYEPATRPMNAAWGWIAAGVFIVVVLAVAFGFGHQSGPGGTNTASNDTAPPAISHTAPPASAPAPAGTGPASSSPAPVSPTPNPAPNANH
jgi:hypothetical protein